ncbi:MAG: carbohydrate-binding protein [Waterburya sp.]
MDTNLTNVNFLTHNNVGDYNPEIDNKNVVWTSYDGNDDEIYLYDHDNASVTKLTDNDTYESNAQISGNNVVWSANDGNDNEIYLYNGSETIQLTDNDVNDGSPQVSGNNVAWLSYTDQYFYPYPNESEIYLYNGLSTIQLTDSDTYIGEFSISEDNVVWSEYDGKDSEIYFYDGSSVNQITTNSTSDYNPQISGSNIVWSASGENDSEIYLYNGSETIQVTDNDTYDSSPEISGDNIVWSAYDGNDDEIYLYNGSETIQVTDNDRSDYSPLISGDNIVWSAYDGNGDEFYDDEIYFFNGTETIQLTNNDTSDYNPQISGNNITWSGYDGNDNEIYLNFSPNLDPGEINGYKWHDLNKNGLFDGSESGIEGWTIYLDDNQNGQLDDGETSTVTDGDGFYSFTDLIFGNYSVAEQNEPRWNQTYPVAVGYEWQDSKQPDGTTFDWVDISGVGTELDLGDDESAGVALPFSFDFYGEAQDTVNISANGYLTFDDNGTESYNNGITESYNLSNFIAPFWDDLNPGHSGSIYHHYDASGDRFIVQYQDVARYEVEDSLTFQTILNSDGSIVYQYNDLDGRVDSATMGLENADGSRGLQIVYNNKNYDTPYLESGLAISFNPVLSSDNVNSHEVFVATGETISNINFGNSLPGIRIETEDYQDYYDSTSGNEGGEYRDDDVDLGLSHDVGGGFTVGWIDSGEWLTYDIDVPEDGTYQVIARVASDLDTSHSLDVSIDGQVNTVEFGSTGGWNSWSDAVGGNLELTAGSHELRLDMGSSGFNLNYVDLITPEDIRIEAEDYQGNYDQYYDNDYENQGGGYRNDEVDIEPARDIGGGFNVGWIESGEWLTYSVDIPYTDNYQVVGRVASDFDADHSIDVSINGESTTLNFGSTGDWQSYEDVIGDELVYLTPGTYELRLDMGSSYFNINYLDFVAEQNDELFASNSDADF